MLARLYYRPALARKGIKFFIKSVSALSSQPAIPSVLLRGIYLVLCSGGKSTSNKAAACCEVADPLTK